MAPFLVTAHVPGIKPQAAGAEPQLIGGKQRCRQCSHPVAIFHALKLGHGSRPYIEAPPQCCQAGSHTAMP